MNETFSKYRQMIDNLPLEARAIVLIASCGFIFLIWFYGLWATLQTNISKTNSAIKGLESTIPLLKTQLQATKENIKNSREQAAKNKEKDSSQIKNSAPQLISPDKIREVLQDLLSSRHKLTLLQLQNFPPKTVLLPQTNQIAFEHGIIIKFQGDFLSTMNYLQALEELGWRIFWDKLEYKVIKYPRAETTLQIHTLGNKGDWLEI
jgi:MSHA biogenesis protein MshJ